MKDTILNDIQISDGVVAEIGRRGGKYFTTVYGEAYTANAGRKYQTFCKSKAEAEERFEGLKEYYGEDD